MNRRSGCRLQNQIPFSFHLAWNKKKRIARFKWRRRGGSVKSPTCGYTETMLELPLQPLHIGPLPVTGHFSLLWSRRAGHLGTPLWTGHTLSGLSSENFLFSSKGRWTRQHEWGTFEFPAVSTHITAIFQNIQNFREQKKCSRRLPRLIHQITMCICKSPVTEGSVCSSEQICYFSHQIITWLKLPRPRGPPAGTSHRTLWVWPCPWCYCAKTWRFLVIPHAPQANC